MKALIAGSTGLTGKELISLLQASPRFEKVVSLVRNEQKKTGKIESLVVDWDQIETLSLLERFDVGFCCLGTTIKAAGSQDNFKKVDFQFIVNFAKLCHRQGVRHFILISAAGASAQSQVFYSRIKGETEEEIQRIGFPQLDILRPGLLIGERKESRVFEAVAQKILPLFDPLLVGPLRAYRTLRVQELAKRMFDLALKTQ